MLFPLFFSMRALPDTYDVHGKGVVIDRGQAWTGCRHGQGAGMDRMWAWTRHGHRQGMGKGMAGTWLTLSYDLGAWTMARKDGS